MVATSLWMDPVLHWHYSSEWISESLASIILWCLVNCWLLWLSLSFQRVFTTPFHKTLKVYMREDAAFAFAVSYKWNFAVPGSPWSLVEKTAFPLSCMGKLVAYISPIWIFIYLFMLLPGLENIFQKLPQKVSCCLNCSSFMNKKQLGTWLWISLFVKTQQGEKIALKSKPFL